MSSTYIVICPIVIDSNGAAHLGFGAQPEFKNYIESVFPKETIGSYDKWNTFVVSTNFSGLIEGVPEITLLTGEKREFSYWMLEPENSLFTVRCREMMFFKGQHGIIGMYYGVREKFTPKYWPKLDMNELDVWIRNIRNYHHNFLLPAESLEIV
jgi:hypothetical protein